MDLEDTSLDDESVDSGLPSADCAAPADIKKYEQGEDEDMPGWCSLSRCYCETVHLF